MAAIAVGGIAPAPQKKDHRPFGIPPPQTQMRLLWRFRPEKWMKRCRPTGRMGRRPVGLFAHVGLCSALARRKRERAKTVVERVSLLQPGKAMTDCMMKVDKTGKGESFAQSKQCERRTQLHCTPVVGIAQGTRMAVQPAGVCIATGGVGYGTGGHWPGRKGRAICHGHRAAGACQGIWRLIRVSDRWGRGVTRSVKRMVRAHEKAHGPIEIQEETQHRRDTGAKTDAPVFVCGRMDVLRQSCESKRAGGCAAGSRGG